MGFFGKRFKEIGIISDFETTVDQEHTEVWAAASIKLADPTAPEYVRVQTSIDEYLEYLMKQSENLLVFFHNLRFDGSFILSAVMNMEGWHQYKAADGSYRADNFFLRDNKAFAYTISDTNEWYEIKLSYNGKQIRFIDSLKLLPMTLEDMGKGFDTKYKKLTMEYKGDMKAHGEITEEQMAYIKNDVLVPHEVIKKMRAEGHRKSTIGACCLSEFKKMRYGAYADEYDYRLEFPDLYKVKCPFEGYENADQYIRESYHGGMTTVVKGKENVVFGGGCTYDYNSMYPSQMIAHKYPYGMPHWFSHKIPEEAYENDRYYFVRIRTRFYLKENMLPTVQIKGNVLYNSREWLTTSDVDGKKFYIGVDGKLHRTEVTMTMTMTDFKLLQEHYRLEDCVILDGCWFDTKAGMFDEYVNYWADKKIKAVNKAERLISKLFLNNLYGKFSQSNKNEYKVYHMCEDGIMRSEILEDKRPKEPGYIPVGAAITAYAREALIEAGQANYEYLVYMDTDSIHCCCKTDKIKGIKIHDSDLGAWKLETTWDEGIFVRAKTYVEHIYDESNPYEDDGCYYNVKCAGMGKGPKEIFVKGLEDGTYKITDFKKGLTLPNNLKARLINGGTVLMEMEYKMS